MLKSVLLFLTVVFSSFSFAQSEPQEIVLPVSYSNWVSSDYLNCMETKLPCECEKNGEVFLLDLDTVSRYVNLYEGGSNQDYGIAYLQEFDSNSYYVIFHSATDIVDTLGLISLSGDTLSYRVDDKETRFVKFGEYYYRSYLQGNVTWMNEQLKIRGYSDLQTILKTKYPQFFCNWELSAINLIYDGGKNWILEMENNELVIYRWKNPPKQKRIELNIKKKEIARLKW